ncbi:MAG: TetR/AcrR family transcriptional regulator [Candidatus Obscuribacterales bacterium]|nr:TetR/AcrR family transcriptional regulator [Candidatus Obscuribacterales bacterium]
MARPRADNYEQRRQEILDTAATMFAKKGFDGTSIADIAQRCGVSKALLYHYYPSKDALLYDMLHSHCELLVGTANDALQHADQPQSQLQSLIRALMNLYMDSRNKHIVLLNDLHCLSVEQQSTIKRLEKSILQIIKDILEKLRPDLTEPMRTSLAMYLMGAINWTYTWFKPNGPFSAHEFADVATSVFLKGIQSDLGALNPST